MVVGAVLVSGADEAWEAEGEAAVAGGVEVCGGPRECAGQDQRATDPLQPPGGDEAVAAPSGASVAQQHPGRGHGRAPGCVSSSASAARAARPLRPSASVESRWRVLSRKRGAIGAGYVLANVRVPGTGAVRLRWERLTSRSVAVRARR